MLLYLLAHLHMMDQVTWGGGEGEGEREGGGNEKRRGGRIGEVEKEKRGGRKGEVERRRKGGGMGKRRGVAAYEGGTNKERRKKVDGEDRRWQEL